MKPIAKHPTKKFLAYYPYLDNYHLIFHNKYGVVTEILDKAYDQLEVLRSHYSKVTVILIQLHQSLYSKSSKQLTLLISKLKTKLQKHYGCEIGYFWVREQNHAASQHYHMVVMVNGHKCQSSALIDLATSTYWQYCHPDNFSFKVRNRIYRVRQDDGGKELRAVRMRMSYMAKKNSKTHLAPFTKSYGYSRLKRKNKPASN